MQPPSRRDALRLALAAAASGPAHGREPIQSTFAGVTLGVQGYSFRMLSEQAAIQAMVDIGIGACEANYAHIEPAAVRKDRAALRDWRLKVPMAEFERAGQRYRAAGIDPWAYTCNFRTDFTDAEMERGFEMTQALGAHGISSSANLSMVPRIDRLARKYRIRVGLHNHSRIAADEIATPDDLTGALRGASEYLGILLDIGHFVAADFDPLPFLRAHHSRIIAVHVKDRKRHQGPNVPFGQGDTPIKEVLRLIRDEKYPIHADIEYEYDGVNAVVEVRKCFAYCKEALLA